MQCQNRETHLNAVVPRPSRNVLPMRIPLALREANARIVITAWLPSAANQVSPGPSLPAGHNTLVILLNCESVLEGDATIWALCKGMGTSEDENGVAPAENGTFGLLVLFNVPVVFPNAVMNEPAKNKLAWEALVVIESTSDAAFARPPNGGALQADADGSQTATDDAGELKLPPNQTFF